MKVECGAHNTEQYMFMCMSMYRIFFFYIFSFIILPLPVDEEKKRDKSLHNLEEIWMCCIQCEQPRTVIAQITQFSFFSIFLFFFFFHIISNTNFYAVGKKRAFAFILLCCFSHIICIVQFLLVRIIFIFFFLSFNFSCYISVLYFGSI